MFRSNYFWSLPILNSEFTYTKLRLYPNLSPSYQPPFSELLATFLRVTSHLSSTFLPSNPFTHAYYVINMSFLCHFYVINTTFLLDVNR